MISGRRGSIVVLALIGLPALSFEVFSGGIDQPPDSRGLVSHEQAAPAKHPSVGVQEVSRPEGGRDVIYFSLTPLEEKQARQQAETYKQEKSLELLNNAIIIRR